MYQKTDWKDRIVQRPLTYTMQQNADGTVTLIPAPGTVTQQGTPVNAALLNKIEDGLVETTKQLATYSQLINFLQDLKADISYVDTVIASIGAGIKGVFPTWSALNNAYPSGTSGLFLVLENNHTFYWNETTWADAGLFQGIEVADKSITTQKRTVLGEAGYIVSATTFNINKQAQLIEFPPQTYVFYRNKFVQIANLSVDLTPAENGGFLYFDTNSNLIWATHDAVNIGEDCLYLGTIWNTPRGYQINTFAPYTVNGEPYTDLILDEAITSPKVKNEAITTDKRTLLGGFATIESMYEFDIDSVNKKINFHTDTFVSFNGNFIKIADNVTDISNAINGGFLWYDFDLNKIVDVKPSNGERYLYLGVIWSGTPLKIDINQGCGFTLDGMHYEYLISRFKNGTVNCLGDSITEGVNASKPYHQWLPQLCGFSTVNNFGLAGSSITRKSGTEPSWDTVVPFVDRYSSMPNADVSIIFGGVNDWVTGRPIGLITDTTDTTFYGALKILLDGMKEKYQKILFITPMQNNYIQRPPSGGNTDGTNAVGKTLLDYVNVIKELCGIYSIPVLDLYHNCFYGLGEYDCTNYLTDFLHPNNRGHKEKMAIPIATAVNGL